MLLIELINWWYGRGLRSFALKLLKKLRNTADFFSIGSLLATLFSPFRQISADSGQTGAPFQGLLDRIISRLVGFTLRIGLIIAGFITLILQSLVSIVVTLAYPFMPVTPILCVILWISGVTL